MFHILYKKFELNFTQNANRFIFTLKKLKWVGNLISEEWYVRRDIKNVFGVFGLLKAALWDMIKKSTYFLAALCLPVFILSNLLELNSDGFADMLAWGFFFLNCMMGSFVNSRIFTKGDEKEYLFLNLMRFNPKEHYLTALIWDHGRQILYYGIFLFITLVLICNWSPLRLLWLLGIYACFRFIGEAVRLKINDRFGVPFQEKNKPVAGTYYIYNMFIVMIAYGTYPCLFLLSGKTSGVILPLLEHAGFMLVFLVIAVLLGMLSAKYLLHYPDYVMVARRMCNKQRLAEAEQIVKNAKKNVYELRDKEVKNEDLQKRLYPDKKGYEYLNAIFFKRHKRLVRNAVIANSLFAGAVFLLAAVALIISHIMMTAEQFSDLSDTIWNGVNNFVPVMVFVMYCASAGEKLTQAFFYNCDVALLKYGYYRAPEAILLNFRIRLRYMLRAELPTVAVLCSGIILNVFLLGKQEHVLQILSILACICTLTVFFSVVFLCMYYIFQPFTEGGSKTGIGYKVCSIGIYVVSYMCLQIDTVPVFFTSIVLAVTVVVLIIGFVIAWLMAPKTFRLK